MFEIVINELIGSNKFSDESINNLLVEFVISYTYNEDHYSLIHKWFLNNKITDLKGNEILNIKLSLKNKHGIVRKIYAS